jgi:hypothetical protein
MLYRSCGADIYVLCSQGISRMISTQNSGQNTPQQTQNTPTTPPGDSKTVPVYVPMQGQGPDYIGKGAGAGKS